MRSSIWNYLKLVANFEHVFLPTDNLQQFRLNLFNRVWGPEHPQNKDNMCYWPVEKSWLFPVCLRSCPTSSFKGCYESATLPLISFPRLSPPLKIKPVSQIISQANQRSLCIWGWEEKLAIKSSLRSLGRKKSYSLFHFSPPMYTLSPSREPFFPWNSFLSWCNPSN